MFDMIERYRCMSSVKHTKIMHKEILHSCNCNMSTPESVRPWMMDDACEHVKARAKHVPSVYQSSPTRANMSLARLSAR